MTQMSADYFFLMVCATTIPAGLVSWATCFWLRRKASRWGLLDRPGGHKRHAQPIPLGGGLGLAAGVVAPFLAGYFLLLCLASGVIAASAAPAFVQPHLEGLWQRSPQLWFLLSAGLILMAIGLLDDIRGLDWRVRLGVQAAVAAASVFGQGWQLTLFVDWPLLTKTLSVLWIIALINAFNMLDNMDGLCAGVAAVAAAALAAVLLNLLPTAGRSPQLFVGGLMLVLTGSLLGFLWHNRPPARLYMGDAGSYFLGYLLAVATLLGSYTQYAGPRPHAVLIPVCILAVPLYDLISVIWIRLREGRSVFQGDNRHFSHRLVALGMSKPLAVATIYLVAIVCGVGGILLPLVNTIGAIIVASVVFAFLLLVARLESLGAR